MMSNPQATVDEIATTIVSVAHFIDKKRWGDLRSLYADTVTTDYTSLFGGEVQQQSADALIDAWCTLLTPLVTQHLLGPIALQVSSATATAGCHVRGYHYKSGAAGGDEWMVAGHYSFGLIKEASAWLIRSMTLETFYQSGNLKLLEVAGGK